MSLAVLILFCFFTIIFSQADFECLMTRSHVTSLDSQICVFAKANIHSNILSVYTVEVHVLWEMKSWSENQKSQRCSSLTWAHLYILKKGYLDKNVAWGSEGTFREAPIDFSLTFSSKGTGLLNLCTSHLKNRAHHGTWSRLWCFFFFWF